VEFTLLRAVSTGVFFLRFCARDAVICRWTRHSPQNCTARSMWHNHTRNHAHKNTSKKREWKRPNASGDGPLDMLKLLASTYAIFSSLNFIHFRRVIETWMDPKYKEYFYTREPLARYVDMGDISEQLELKDRLKCKSFDWFMKEIAYDVFDKYAPLPPNKFWGELKNLANNFCLDSQSRHPPEKVSNKHCFIEKY
jgi:hypothetical protein